MLSAEFSQGVVKAKQWFQHFIWVWRVYWKYQPNSKEYLGSVNATVGGYLHNSNGVYCAVSLEFVILDNYCVVELKLTK